MISLTTADETRKYSGECRSAGRKLAWVPTLGGLHAGHARQIETARQGADAVVVSVFLDPEEFGPNEDYAQYPRNLEEDRAFCEKHGADALFAPSRDEIHHGGKHSTYVMERVVAAGLCGNSRTHHFRGVATTFVKLFQIIQPEVAVASKHEIQRLGVIRRVARDLFLPLEVVGAPIAREEDGLACDTRNRFLNPSQREEASQIHQALQAGKAIFDQGNPSVDRVTAEVINQLRVNRRLHVLYAHLVDNENLNLVREMRAGECLLCVGVLIDQIRLLDHLEF